MKLFSLLPFGIHLDNGSPEYPFGQTQMALWLITLHIAFIAHDPGQGSIHF